MAIGKDERRWSKHAAFWLSYSFSMPIFFSIVMKWTKRIVKRQRWKSINKSGLRITDMPRKLGSILAPPMYFHKEIDLHTTTYSLSKPIYLYWDQMDQIMTKNESRSIHDAFWWNFSSFVTITNYKNKKERLTYIFIFIVNFLLNYIGIKWTKKMAKTIDKWLKMKTDA